jgi:hypothetical protein
MAAPSFLELTRELSGSIPKLSDLLAANLINQTWAELRDSHRWSWLIAEDAFVIPGLLSGGTMTATQFSTAVQADAAANLLLMTHVFGPPPLVGRQFRISTPTYNIVAYDPPSGILTLDRPYLEQSQVATNWVVFQRYYPAPSIDFLKFLTIVNPIKGYSIPEERCGWTRQQLDIRDPQRGATGDAYYVAFYHNHPQSGIPTYELWPCPTHAVGMPYLYLKRGEDFINDDDTLPATIPSYSFLQLAHYHGCMWAAKNAARFVELGRVNWLQLATGHLAIYEKWLQKAKVADEEIFLHAYTHPWGTHWAGLGPLDATFAQTHDMSDF